MADSEHFWNLSFAKFAPRLRARTIWKSKLIKIDDFGTFLEIQNVFFSHNRYKDFDTLRNTWSAQEFVRVINILVGMMDLKRFRNNVFHMAGATISCFVISMFKASNAKFVEGLQLSCYGSVILQ